MKPEQHMRVHENILPSFHSFFSSQPACLSPFLHFNHIYTLDWKKNRSILDQMFFDVKWGHYLYQNIYYIKTVYAAAAAKSLQSCPTLGNPIDGSPPGSPIPGILQARTLEWVTMPFSRGSSQLRDGTHIVSPTLAGGFFTTAPLGKHHSNLLDASW